MAYITTGVDDFIAQLIISLDPSVHLVGISVIDADCLLEPAYEVARRLLSLVHRDSIPIAKSTLGGVHPFPDEWRSHCERCLDLPVLNISRILEACEKRPIVATTGQQLLVDMVRQSPEPVTIVVTGPMTNVAWALDHDPCFHQNVREVGAVLLTRSLNIHCPRSPIPFTNPQPPKRLPPRPRPFSAGGSCRLTWTWRGGRLGAHL